VDFSATVEEPSLSQKFIKIRYSLFLLLQVLTVSVNSLHFGKMFCSCFGPSESAADFEAHHVRHHFFEVGLAHDVNSKHRESMEDAHVVKVPFMGEESTGFFAIYDGHGGSEASTLASKTLHNLIEAEIKKKGANPSPTMKECFEAAYAAMDEQLKLPGDPGSTAITCLLRREGAAQRIYTANAGDARAVLCRSGRALRLSYDHKPSDEKEKQRITELGGFVTSDRVNGILAISRALGDHPFKKWVISTPFFVESDMNRSDSMLLIACDGLWDVIGDQEAVDLVRGAHTHTHTHARMHTHARTHTRTHTHTHARTHNRTYARTHTLCRSDT
jgi:protein phosphatase PTC1